jgi:hypothetical protein
LARKQLSGVRNAERNCRIMFHSHGKLARSGRPLFATHDLNRQKLKSFAMEKLNIGLSSVSDIAAGFG